MMISMLLSAVPMVMLKFIIFSKENYLQWETHLDWVDTQTLEFDGNQIQIDSFWPVTVTEPLSGTIEKQKLSLGTTKVKQGTFAETTTQMAHGQVLATKNMKLKFMIAKRKNLFKYLPFFTLEIRIWKFVSSWPQPHEQNFQLKES